MGALARIVNSATSFRPTLVLTSRAARSVVSMIRWRAATSHSTSRVASLNEYFLPASSGRRPIQKRLHRKVVETSGAESSCEAISPRWMKICSSSVMPVDWPAVASVGTGSTLKASIVLTVAVLFEGEKISRSEEHTSELQSLAYLVCRLLLEKKKKKNDQTSTE